MLPVRGPSGPGGPLVDAMGGMNALTRSNLENVIKGAEAQYAPWTQYANALSKIAYSQFVGPQSLATMMNDPKIRGMLTDDQYRSFLNQFTNQLGSGAATSMVPVPGQQSGGSLIGNIFNRIFGQRNAKSPQNLPVPTNSMNYKPSPQMPIAQPQMTGDFGANNQASPALVDYIAHNGNAGLNQNNLTVPPTIPSQPVSPQLGTNLSGTTPTYATESQKLPSGVMGAENPAAITSAGEGALKARTEAEAKLIADQWKVREDDAREQVSGSQEMQRQLNRLELIRDQLSSLEKGPLLGSLPAMTNAAQESDTVSNNLVAAKLKAWQSSRITNMDIGFGQMLKPGRYMKDEPFKNELNYEKSFARRIQELPAFNDMAKRSGLTPNQADAVWTRYANEMPFYDPKTKKVLDKNLESWEKYLTPQSIKETFSPSFRKKMEEYRKNMSGGDSKEDKKIVDNYNEGKKEPSQGARILSKKIEFPSFKNDQEFKTWFQRQPKVVKDAVILKLKNEGK